MDRFNHVSLVSTCSMTIGCLWEMIVREDA